MKTDVCSSSTKILALTGNDLSLTIYYLVAVLVIDMLPKNLFEPGIMYCDGVVTSNTDKHTVMLFIGKLQFKITANRNGTYDVALLQDVTLIKTRSYWAENSRDYIGQLISKLI